jgi:ABC-2 type transport system ATP-binding protein
LSEAQHLKTYYGAKPAPQDVSFFEENGCDVSGESPKVREHIGYMPEDPPLYGEMSPRSFREFAARINQMSGREMGNRIVEVMRKADVAVAADTLVHLKIGKRSADNSVFVYTALTDRMFLPEDVIVDDLTIDLDGISEIQESVEGKGNNS